MAGVNPISFMNGETLRSATHLDLIPWQRYAYSWQPLGPLLKVKLLVGQM